MTEWAVLFSLLRKKDFGTDTVIVRDGFLRSRRRLYLVGIASTLASYKARVW
jgi:hypothetical protein